MDAPWKRARFILALAALALGAVPAASAAQAAPAVDCDSFADGQQEVPIVMVTSPAPGTVLPAGPLTIQGAALDCHADSGIGISRVSVFLGKRDAGGLHLGDAVLREPSPIQVLPADQYAKVGWTLAVPAPANVGQLNELYVYARSDVNNAEAVVAVPISGAIETTPTPVPTAVPVPTPAPAMDNTPADPPQLAPETDEAPPIDETAAGEET